jgi:hypothetical protein
MSARRLLVGLVVALVLAAGLGWWWDARQAQDRERAASADRAALELHRLRAQLASADSAREADAASWALQVHRAASDSLAAWLRARAARPLPARIESVLVVRDIRDTLRLPGAPLVDSVPVCLESGEARRLLLRDSALVDLADSLRGDRSLDSARLDSVRALVVPQRTPWGLLGAAAGAGYVAGLLTCLSL